MRRFLRHFLFLLAVLPFLSETAIAENNTANPIVAGPTHSQTDLIRPWIPRFGRSIPVIAVVGENSGTEVSDFIIPYGVLSQSGVAKMVTVATYPGPILMRPALQILPDATTDQFDLRFPEGADFVIVPAVIRREDPKLLRWLAEQGNKGATVVSICDGALVVGNSGLMDGHRATGHWFTHQQRVADYPKTQWEQNARYVADGKIVSSAGITAALPISLALVEAIAGHDRAASLASNLGVSDWSSKHDSAIFEPRFGVNLLAFASTQFVNGWIYSTERVGIPITEGVDEIALAFTADAYSRTGRSHAYTVANENAPVRTLRGLNIVPDSTRTSTVKFDREISLASGIPSARSLDRALSDIAAQFGNSTAYGVALDLEYPGFQARNLENQSRNP